MLKTIWAELKLMLKSVTPAQAVTRELLEAEMALLSAETAVEYSQAAVSYNKNRIKRLKAYVSAPVEEKAA